MKMNDKILQTILKFLDDLSIKDVFIITSFITILMFNWVIYQTVSSGFINNYFFREVISNSIESGCYLTVERDNHYLYLPLGINHTNGNSLVIMYLSQDNEDLITQDFADQCDDIRKLIREIDLNVIYEKG